MPDDEDDAFSLMVLDILSVPFTVMTVQLKLGAEAVLAKKAGVDADEKQLILMTPVSVI